MMEWTIHFQDILMMIAAVGSMFIFWHKMDKRLTVIELLHHELVGKLTIVAERLDRYDFAAMDARLRNLERIEDKRHKG